MRKLIAIMLVLLGMALAAFDQSLPEFKKAIADNPLLAANEREAFSKGYEAYIEGRNRGLNDLLEILKEPSPSSKEQQRKFVDRAEGIKSELKKFWDALEPIKPPTTTALSTREGILRREDRFIETLKGLKVAEQRDFIVEQRRRMLEMADILDTKWSQIKDSDNSIDKQGQDAVNEVEKILQEAIKDTASRNKTKLEHATGLNSNIKKLSETKVFSVVLPQISTAISSISSILDESLKRWGYIRNYMDQRMGFLSDLFRSEGRVMLLFSETRASTQKFIEENGFDKAKSRFDLARNDLDRLPDNYSGSGPKADATEWSKLALEHVNSHLKTSEEAFNAFVRKHEKKFFGPISPDIREELLESGVWDKFESQHRGLDLERYLREWRDESQNPTFVISLNGLSNEDREHIRKSEIGPQLDQLVQKYKDQLKEFEASNTRQARDFLINSLSSRKQLGDGIK